MSALGFLLRIVFSLIGFAVLLLAFAALQHLIERGLEEGPHEPPAGDVPRVPPMRPS